MLQLHKDLAATATPHARELLTRQITATGAAIDRLVYELYALTPEEIALVEAGGAGKPPDCSRLRHLRGTCELELVFLTRKSALPRRRADLQVGLVYERYDLTPE
ncbi:MAG: hypothetical protein ACYCZF_17900 [Anaerolineae bacterium]